MRKPTFVLAALTLTAAALTPAVTFGQESWSWTGRLDAGQRVEIKNANGPLYAERTSGDEVEVFATKEGPARDREEVRIEVVEHAGGVTVCTIYEGGWRENSCEPDRGGRISSTDDNDTEVTFRVRIPDGVEYTGLTMNGDVEVTDLRADVDIDTMNGDIEISTTGWASAKTMNGSIDVSMGAADWTGDMEVSTMNGRITIHLPADANVDLDAKTMNGEIDSDFPVSLSGWFNNRARGQIGDGGRGLSVSTMNGSIRIRKS